jgi:hypothetical protein
MKQLCPICYAPMLTYSDYLDGHTLLEAGEDCPYGCFAHRYGYGNTEITVNIRGHHIQFFYSHLESHRDVKIEWEAVEVLFVPARAALIEDLRAQRKAEWDQLRN